MNKTHWITKWSNLFAHQRVIIIKKLSLFETQLGILSEKELIEIANTSYANLDDLVQIALKQLDKEDIPK